MSDVKEAPSKVEPKFKLGQVVELRSGGPAQATGIENVLH